MQEAATEAREFTKGLTKDQFLENNCVQRAVVMDLIIIGEAATNIMDCYPEFADAHSEVPWHKMRGIRNRVTHGYFEIDLNVIWETVQLALPELLRQLSDIQDAA